MIHIGSFFNEQVHQLFISQFGRLHKGVPSIWVFGVDVRTLGNEKLRRGDLILIHRNQKGRPTITVWHFNIGSMFDKKLDRF